jgi:hypothetical protein
VIGTGSVTLDEVQAGRLHRVVITLGATPSPSDGGASDGGLDPDARLDDASADRPEEEPPDAEPTDLEPSVDREGDVDID